jgi:hypothetical protein
VAGRATVSVMGAVCLGGGPECRRMPFPWSGWTESPVVERVSRRRHVLDVGLTTGLGGAGLRPTSLEMGRSTGQGVRGDAVPGQSPAGRSQSR